MARLIEKPSPSQTRQLVHEHGAGSLRLLQGRMHITQDLLRYLDAASRSSGGEPKLSLALAAYARGNIVHVVTTTQPMADLGLAGSEV